MKKKGNYKKVVARVVFALVALVAFVLCLVAFKGGDVAKKYIEEHDRELLGREVVVGDIDVSLLHSAVTVGGVVVKEQDNATDFFRFDTLFVDINLFDLLARKVNLQHIHLVGAGVNVLQRDSVFNFSDIIAHFSKTDTVEGEKEASEPSQWEVGLSDIQLRHCNALYKDLSLKSEFDLKDINLVIPGVYFSDKSTDVGLNLYFPKGGKLHAQMMYDIASSNFQIDAQITDFNISCVEPYMRQGVRVGQVRGLLDTKATMKGNFNHIMNFTLSGTSSLRNVFVSDDKGRLVLSADKTSAELVRLNLMDNEIHLGVIDGEGIASQFLIDKDGNDNISYFSTSPEAVARRERRDSIAESLPDSVRNAQRGNGKQLVFKIDRVDMRNMSMHMSDESLAETFNYDAANFCVRAENISLDRANDVSVSGRLGKTGTVSARWRGSLNDWSNQNVMVTLTNVDLTEFSPYFAPVFAYRITGGNMSLVSQNVVENNSLRGTNQLSVMNCMVEKDKSVENPEFKVPLKTALYVVKDKNGKIDIDLPVAGSIDSPEFSYRKIILATLKNFLVKVGQSPFKSMAKAFGAAGSVDEMPFDPTSASLSVETYEQLNKVVGMLGQKPELKARLIQKINMGDAVADMAFVQLKTACFLKQHPGKSAENLEIIDRNDIAKMSDKDSAFVAYVATVSNTGETNPHKVASAVYAASARQEVDKLAQARAAAIRDYLNQQLGDLAANVDVITPEGDSEEYKGKTLLKLDLVAE